ncbi:MAG: hypothetical protein H6R10_606 [Rhodocyclaceae bacterium]|nr:hypothetical protein [Rhodocyclaceae bacterium]
MNKTQKLLLILSGLGMTLEQALAAGVDLTTLTAAVDVSTVTAGVVAVAAILMAPSVAKYAVNAIRRMFPK